MRHSQIQKYGQSTQLRGTHQAIERRAFQLKNAADVVLSEVQHMEAAQERFAQKAKAKTKARA